MKQMVFNTAKCTAFAVLLASSIGCMKASVAIQPVSGSVDARAADNTEKAHFLLWGLVGDGTINVADICPNGAHWMQSQATFVDGLLGALTGGIYSPRTIYIKCASGTSYLLEPNEEEGVTMASPISEEEAATLEVVQ